MAEQTYANPAGRLQKVAADAKGGTKPGKVSVPMPGTNANQPAYKGGMKQNVPGFQGGIIPGKI